MFHVSSSTHSSKQQRCNNCFFYSSIGGHYRRKVVAKDWHSNGDPLAVSGELEMFQQSEYDLTNVELEFKGLNENSGYHVHIVSWG